MANGIHHRILVIDANPLIHEDFHRVFRGSPTSAGSDLAVLFGDAPASDPGESEQDVFEIDTALQGQEGLAKLKQSLAEGNPYSVAFVDMRMPPGWNGIETIRELWKADRNLQVVICSAYSDYSPEEISRNLGENGGMLLLRKPFDSLEVRQLVSALSSKWLLNRRRGELEVVVDQRTAELKRLALHDPLTGLPNRLLFQDRLRTALQRRRRDPAYKCAVLFIDADGFKGVNDSLGHEAGDQLLLQIAERLRESIRETDSLCPWSGGSGGEGSVVAARLGGDEFAVMLDGIHEDQDAARVAQRILTRCGEPYTVKNHTVHCSVSIGITTSTLGYEDAEGMLRDADTAMYHAKHEGRARVAVFDQEMHERVMSRLTMESELREAIEKDQIILHYQPILALRTGNLVGFEALARWNHPVRGWIPPTEFIPIAEQTGTIIPLGAKLLREACQQLKVWQTQWPLLVDLSMSVNVARQQLRSPDFLRQIGEIIEATGIPAHNLKIEITESSVMEDPETTLAILNVTGRVKTGQWWAGQNRPVVLPVV
ncbi:MAG: diguanylate cyclase [Planctomycetota bacterium]|nr:diguanylate cyclase [Planctomycetota bacterium]